MASSLHQGEPRRARAVLLVALGVALFAASLYTWLDKTLPVAVRSLLGHPFWFGLGALALVTIAVASLVVSRSGRVAVAIAASLLALLWALAWFLLGFVFGNFELTDRRPAPGSGSLEVRIEDGAAAVDPLWRFSVRRWAGMRTRDWAVGCVNGDDPDDSYAGMKWIDEDTFVVETNDARSFTVNVNPDTGEPDTGFSVGSC